MIDWGPVLLSLRVGLTALAFVFVTGTLAARAMTRRDFPGKDVVDGLLVLPLVLPPVVTGFLLLLILGRNGPVGGFLEESLGIRLLFTLHAAVIAAAVVARTGEPELARAYAAFLLGPAGRELLRRRGFRVE